MSSGMLRRDISCRFIIIIIIIKHKMFNVTVAAKFSTHAKTEYTEL